MSLVHMPGTETRVESETPFKMNGEGNQGVSPSPADYDPKLISVKCECQRSHLVACISLKSVITAQLC